MESVGNKFSDVSTIGKLKQRSNIWWSNDKENWICKTDEKLSFWKLGEVESEWSDVWKKV